MSNAVIWVDSRSRPPGGTDSDFEVTLRESVHLSNARLRVDKLTFSNSMLTTDAGAHLYFRASGGIGINTHTIPAGAYTGPTLANAIQAATGRTTTYGILTNSITHTLAAVEQPWMDDADLAAHTLGGFPPGATRDNPRSLNAILGEGVNDGILVKWSFVRMNPYDTLYLRSNRLRCVDHHGPRGTHDILCSVPLTQGPGEQVVVSSPDGVYYNLQGEISIRSFDIRLTDYLDRPVNLRGRPLALQLTFNG